MAVPGLLFSLLGNSIGKPKQPAGYSWDDPPWSLVRWDCTEGRRWKLYRPAFAPVFGNLCRLCRRWGASRFCSTPRKPQIRPG